MSFVVPEHLQAILKNLPHKPGPYLMKDAEGTIIYIGNGRGLCIAPRAQLFR